MEISLDLSKIKIPLNKDIKKKKSNMSLSPEERLALESLQPAT